MTDPDPVSEALALRLEEERSRLRRRILLLALRPWILGLLLVGCVSVCHESGLDSCAECGSYRSVSNWGLSWGWGDEPTLRILRNEPVEESRLLADLLPFGHEHRWRRCHHRWFGLLPVFAGPISHGDGYRNAFGNAYEKSDALRTFVLGEIRAGRASREEVVDMVGLSRTPWRDDEGERALRARAYGWMKEHAPECRASFMNGSVYAAPAPPNLPAPPAPPAAASGDVPAPPADPWNRKAREALETLRADPRFARFLPVDADLLPPFLVAAERNPGPAGTATVNVIQNHLKLCRAVLERFRGLMAEAGLPVPTEAELGSPVLPSFFFRNRRSFEEFGEDQGSSPDRLRGVGGLFQRGPEERILMFDTGASTDLQPESTSFAARLVALQVLHCHRRYYAAPEGPKAPGVPDGLPWFTDGFAALFGGADRISVQAGEWKFLRPYRALLMELWDRAGEGKAEWTIPDLLQPADEAAVAALARDRWPAEAEAMSAHFAARAWALHHYLYFGREGAYRERYLHILRAGMTGRAGPETFFEVMEAGEGEARRAFLDGLEEEVRRYVVDLARRR